jgi:lysophospholipase L1-like esterase
LRGSRILREEGFFIKKIVINLGVMLVSLILCVCSFEVIIRAFQLAPDVFLQPNSDTGVWHIPNKQGIYFRKDVPPVKIKINSQGLRDYEYPLFRPERDYRVSVVGDSFSEAFQVPLDDTFYQLLETRLNAARQTKRFDVINFGVGGFGTVHEYLAFHQHVRAYHPNMVLLQFMLGNDILDNSPILNGRQYLPYFILGNHQELEYLPPKPIPYYMKLGGHFKLIPFCYYRAVEGNPGLEQLLRGIKRSNQDQTGVPQAYHIYDPVWNEDWQQAWEITKQVLLRFFQDVLAQKMDFMVFGVPDQLQIDERIRKELFVTYPGMSKQEWDWEKPNKLLQQFCNAQHIPYVDLTPQFKAQMLQSSTPLYYRYDGHWNRNGHRLTADCLYEILKERMVLSSHR